jgi:hypothetical protein
VVLNRRETYRNAMFTDYTVVNFLNAGDKMSKALPRKDKFFAFHVTFDLPMHYDHMRHKYYLPMVVLNLFTFFACNEVQDTTGQDSDLEEITPFIETRVIVYDTMKLKNSEEDALARTYMGERGVRFLSYAGFNTLVKQLKNTFYDPKALIYHSSLDDSSFTLKDRRKMMIICNSIEMMNIGDTGEMVSTKMFACDSTSFWNSVNTIMFYESWYYNKNTGEIVKKQLGYGVWQWVEEKEALRERYVNFTSKEAREIVVKYY